MVLQNPNPIYEKGAIAELVSEASVLVSWVGTSVGKDHIPYNIGLHLSGLPATIVHFSKSFVL